MRIEEQIDSIDLYGVGPVACLQDYQQEVIALTKGKGRMICHMKGYFPCHNQEDIIKQKGYDSETDQAHPTGSVFCRHGAGFYVAWDEVEQYMHIPYQYTKIKIRIIHIMMHHNIKMKMKNWMLSFKNIWTYQTSFS